MAYKTIHNEQNDTWSVIAEITDVNPYPQIVADATDEAHADRIVDTLNELAAHNHLAELWAENDKRLA